MVPLLPMRFMDQQEDRKTEIGASFASRAHHKSPSSILICCIRLIGDVILTTPLIGLLRAAYPDVAIDLLVNKKTGEFLEKDPRVREVVYAQVYDVDRDDERVKGRGYLRKVFRKYDLAINMNASDRGNMAVVLAGKRKRVGFHHVGDSFLGNFWKRLLMTHSLEYPTSIHTVYLCQIVAQALDIKGDKLEARVYWDSRDEEQVISLLKKRGTGEGFFVIHPFARWPYKYWSFERSVEVSDHVAEQYSLQPIWSSSPLPHEVELLQKITATCRYAPITIAGELNLNQMTCLLSRASLYIGLDTAISHLAATTHIPMVVLYGPTPTERWAPWNNGGPDSKKFDLPRGMQRTGNVIIIQKDWECVPCGEKGCPDKWNESDCMNAIEMAEVSEAVEVLLNNPT